jgi:hypothetical protein
VAHAQNAPSFAPRVVPVDNDVLSPEGKRALEESLRAQGLLPNNTPAPSALPKQVNNPVAIWPLNQGSLKTNLQAWVKRVGYRLEWKLPHDFSISHPATLQVPLFGVKGALYLIEEAYADSHHAIRIQVFHGNKVVVVDAKAKSLQAPR